MSLRHDDCQSLYEISIWSDYEYEWIPNLRCGALDRARNQLAGMPPMYVVTATYVDLVGSERAVRCFDSEEEAIDFMCCYRGRGDYLHLHYGRKVLGYADLCYDAGTYTYLPQSDVIIERVY